MNKFVSVLMIGLLPTLATASDVVDLVPGRTEVRPVVSVIALTEDQARELAKVRGEYQEVKSRLDAEYEARLHAVLASSEAGKH